jgi:hypothetical protein
VVWLASWAAGGTVACLVFWAAVVASVVGVAEVPGFAGLDELLAVWAGAADGAGGYVGCPLGAELGVLVAVAALGGGATPPISLPPAVVATPA